MSNHSRTERERLADLLAEAGPDAPTLCGGWLTRDLAAHLVVRERRPDAALGLVIPPLAGWTAKVERRYAAVPYPRLVEDFRSGPPRVSLFALPGADANANLIEYFVHAEDVRRAGDDWQSGPVSTDLAEALWKRLPALARFETGRKSPVRLILQHPDGRVVTTPGNGSRAVRITGEPGELVLFAFGRGSRAAVRAEGEPADVAALREALPLP